MLGGDAEIAQRHGWGQGVHPAGRGGESERYDGSADADSELRVQPGAEVPGGVFEAGDGVPVAGGDRPGANLYFPQVVFIDKKGIIRAYHPATDEAFFKNEEANMRKMIEGLMKEGPGVVGAASAKKKV